MENRIQRDEDDELDEVVTNGGAHLERLDTDFWFLECHRSDGTSVALWIRGRVTMEEERPARDRET